MPTSEHSRAPTVLDRRNQGDRVWRPCPIMSIVENRKKKRRNGFEFRARGGWRERERESKRATELGDWRKTLMVGIRRRD